MTLALISPQEAELEIAPLTTAQCSLEVMEERAFVNEDKWFALGSICLKAAPQPTHENAEQQRALLAYGGAFEWSLPSASNASAQLRNLLNEDNEAEVRRILDSVAAVGMRTGLVNPVFDSESIESMPFRRTTTVVSDTTGVLQGGLNFIVRHVPKARVKVPAIVQMEIRESSDNFLKIRRDTKSQKSKHRPARQLKEHLKSQGGERVLHRLELQDDVEIERTHLLGDPLRSAFRHDRNAAVSGLNLNIPVRSYVDRLVLEAARDHQALSEPGHAVLLLTGDQGQARMALAEGVRALYFRSVSAKDLFGQHLAGRPLDPFTGEPLPVPLASLLWEFATAFGRARLVSDDGTFTVSAIGEDLPWSLYQSINDLLWYEVEYKAPRPRTVHQASEEPIKPPADNGPKSVGPRPAVPPAYQRMNVNLLLTLICALDDRQTMDQNEITALLSLSSYSISHYRRFLASGEYILLAGDRWMARDRLKAVAIAARTEDPRSMRNALAHAPSFHNLVQRTERLNNGEPLDLSDLDERSKATYQVLGELTLLCASVGREFVFPTLNSPPPSEFAQLALTRFKEMAGVEKIVATGLWLESLIRHDGIHPEVAQRSLEQASEMGLLHRSTEGSTAQTRYDDHVVHVLRVEEGTPVAKPIHLYRGDYLIPGKASVSLRLKEPTP